MAPVPLILLKLTLTPFFVGGASLAARRWGPAFGGWIVSLPLTSGPVLFFLAAEHGPAFATDASVGTLLGMGAIVAYSLGFAVTSGRSPATAIVAASVCFAVAGVALQATAAWSFAVLAALVVLAIGAAIRWLPSTGGARSAVAHPRWDLPARVIVGTGLVLGLTGIAPLLGPVPSGIVSTFPVYVSVLAAFALVHEGRPAALGVLRGVLTGMFGTVAFYAAIHALMVPAGIGPAFLVAIAVTLAVQVVALPWVRAAAIEPEPA